MLRQRCKAGNSPFLGLACPGASCEREHPILDRLEQTRSSSCPHSLIPPLRFPPRSCPFPYQGLISGYSHAVVVRVYRIGSSPVDPEFPRVHCVFWLPKRFPEERRRGPPLSHNVPRISTYEKTRGRGCGYLSLELVRSVRMRSAYCPVTWGHENSCCTRLAASRPRWAASSRCS